MTKPYQMTKKELKEYIKEIILQEVSQEDVESAKELNKELEKTKELSDELGLTNESEFNKDRFLQSAGWNLAMQMRGKSASRTTLSNRLNRMPLANRLKPDELEKIIDYAMEEMGLNEAIDTNDPVLMKMRASMDARKKKKSDFGKEYGDAVKVAYGSDKNAKKLAFLKKERAQLMRDMEQEAEPEGGPIADEYGEKLNKIDAAIAKLKEQSGWGGEKDVNISRDEIERRASMIKEENKKKTLKKN
jgi:hypothetical protein